MPKARKKRRIRTTDQLTRSSTRVKAKSSTQNQEENATYFDLTNQPNSSLKSKNNNEFIASPKLPRNLKVPTDWNVKPGDVLSWSKDRPTEVYFVTAEQTLLKNPDSSGSGYLTIPLSITSLFPDALKHYQLVLNAVGISYVTSIEISPKDTFFLNHFSNESLPTSISNRNDIKYSYDPNEEILFVDVLSNPGHGQYFPLNSTKMDDIVQWILTSNELKAMLRVTFKFEGQAICSKVPRGVIKGLPTGWKCEQDGSLMVAEDNIEGAWKCQGPEKTKNDAKKAIEKHYKGLSIKIN